MPHSLACTLEKLMWIVQKSTIKKSDVHVCLKNIHITKSCVVHTGDRTSIVQNFRDVISTLTKYAEPLPRDREQLMRLAGKPFVDFEQMIDRSGKSE